MRRHQGVLLAAEALQEPDVLWKAGAEEEVGCLGVSLLLGLGWVWKRWLLGQVAYLVTRLQLVIHRLSPTLRSICLVPC